MEKRLQDLKNSYSEERQFRTEELVDEYLDLNGLLSHGDLVKIIYLLCLDDA